MTGTIGILSTVKLTYLVFLFSPMLSVPLTFKNIYFQNKHLIVELGEFSSHFLVQFLLQVSKDRSHGLSDG